MFLKGEGAARQQNFIKGGHCIEIAIFVKISIFRNDICATQLFKSISTKFHLCLMGSFLLLIIFNARVELKIAGQYVAMFTFFVLPLLSACEA